MTGAQPSDLELIHQARDGDDGAFRMLVDRYESQVAATVVGMLGQGPDAEDVGQETFIRFHAALDKFRGESALGTYLTRIAINLSLNVSKSRRGSSWRFWSLDKEEDPAPAPTTDGRATQEQADTSAEVQAALHMLKPEHRAVVVLRMIKEYSTRETAEALGLREGTVLSRLSRGMSSLKTILQRRGLAYEGE